MITHQVSETANLNDLLTCDPNVIKRLVMLAVVSMAEANVDMVLDEPHDFTAKQHFDSAFSTDRIRSQVKHYLDDILPEIETAIMDAVETIDFDAVVRSIQFNEHGDLEDVLVDVK